MIVCIIVINKIVTHKINKEFYGIVYLFIYIIYRIFLCEQLIIVFLQSR
jgi:hypothetical protein